MSVSLCGRTTHIHTFAHTLYTYMLMHPHRTLHANDEQRVVWSHSTYTYIYTHNTYICVCLHDIYIYMCVLNNHAETSRISCYGMASVSRIDRIIGLFCERAL